MRQLLLPLIVMILLMLVQFWLGYNLRFDLTPLGIVALEFCDNLPRLNTILSLWDLELSQRVIYSDFLFILAYTWLFYSATKHVHRQCKLSFLESFTRAAIYVSLLPGLLDVAENSLMLVTLSGYVNQTLLTITSWVAALKFAFVAMVLLYLLVSLLLIYAKTKKQAIRKEEELPGRT